MNRRLPVDDVILDAFALTGTNDSDWNRALGRKWAENALGLIGVMPEEYEHKVEEIAGVNGRFKKPDKMLAPMQVFLCINDNLIEATYAGSQPSELWTNYPCCTYYNKYHGDYGVKENGTHFFLTNSAMADSYDKMIVYFIGLAYDDDGYVLIPYKAREAVVKYLVWYFLQMARSNNRTGIPHSEIMDARREFYDMAGHARGEMKSASKLKMDRLAREAWLRAPIRQPHPLYGKNT